jgi:hypothetical protein
MSEFISKKSFRQFLANEKINLANTEWKIGFFNSYLRVSENKPIMLGVVKFGEGGEGEEIAYSLSLNKVDKIFEEINIDSQKKEKLKKEFSHILLNSLRRLGLETNFLKRKELKAIFEKNKQVYFIYDTNTIRNGTFIYFVKNLGEKAIHAIPKHVKMELQAQIVEKEEKVKKLKEGFFEYYEVSNNSLRDLSQAEQGVTLETIGPDIFRFLETEGRGQTKRNIAYDRFIIETARKIVEERNLNIDIYIVTSDYDLARFACLERVNVLYVKPPSENLFAQAIYSFQYDLAFDKFIFTSISDLIWEWTNLFTGIVMENNVYKLTCTYYPPQREISYWKEDLIRISVKKKSSSSKTPPKEFQKKVYAIKRMSLDNLLDIIEFFEDKNKVSFNAIKDLLGKSNETVKNHLYFLSDIDVLKKEGDEYLPGDKYAHFMEAWENENVDARLKTVNEIFLSHPSFKKWFKWLKEHEKITPSMLPPKFSKRAHEVVVNILRKLGWIYKTIDKQITYTDNFRMKEEEFNDVFMQTYQKLSQKQGITTLELAELFDSFMENYHVPYYHLLRLFKSFYMKMKGFLNISSGGMPYKEHYVIYLNERKNKERWTKINLYDGVNIGKINIKALELLKC